MDAVFKTASTMTDHFINDKGNIDTKPFRDAVRHYTFRLYGVNDDLMTIDLLMFIYPLN